MNRRTTLSLLGMLLALTAAAWVGLRSEQGFAAAGYAWAKLRGGYTVEDRLRMHAPAVEVRLRHKFVAAGLPYPPVELAYVAFKDTSVMEVYGRAAATGPWRRVLSYPIQGMSGGPGPKLRQGDMQVPEGLYRAEFLNPNSRFHLAIRLDYPNEFDATQARADGRTALGSDIMIHGTTASIGCLAMGNQAAEDLFVLAALAGKGHVEIIVAPTDFRRTALRTPEGGPPWLADLYRGIQAALSEFPSGT